MTKTAIHTLDLNFQGQRHAIASYLIQHRDGTQEVTVDQAAKAGGWVLLGRFPFRAGEAGFVELRDVAGDSMRTIWFDAVKWVRAP